MFLGGVERFQTLYYTAQLELVDDLILTESASSVYEIGMDGQYRFIRCTGEEKFKKSVDTILASLPDEWVPLKSGSSKKLQFTSRVTYNGNTFQRYLFKLEFNLVD